LADSFATSGWDFQGGSSMVKNILEPSRRVDV
jgi:hypothetical protein